MEKIIGIICEFNPFHEGHRYLMECCRKEFGEDSVILCAMSGDFVQRGEAAVFPKEVRAKTACENGADLVVELPIPWSISTAESFAKAGVSILRKAECTHIAFGSECGDLQQLQNTAETVKKAKFKENVSSYIKEHPNCSYAFVRSLLCGNDILNEPNNLLAVEYLKYSSTLIPYTVKRVGSFHDGPGSASELRAKIYAGEIPGDPVKKEILETAIISRLRGLKKEDYEKLCGRENGIGKRLYLSVQNFSTLEEIAQNAKAKHVPLSHIRRLILTAALQIPGEMVVQEPPYLRILAMNERGSKYIRKTSDKGTKWITLPKEIRSQDKFSQNVFACGAYARDLYSLGLTGSEARKCRNEYRITPSFVQHD